MCDTPESLYCDTTTFVVTIWYSIAHLMFQLIVWVAKNFHALVSTIEPLHCKKINKLELTASIVKLHKTELSKILIH